MEIIERTAVSADWMTVALLAALLFLSLAKLVSPTLFDNFLRLAYSDKYLSLSQKKNSFINNFNLLLYAAHILIVSLFLYLVVDFFSWMPAKTPLIVFAQIALFYTGFFVVAYFLEKIIGNLFEIEKITDNYLNHKISYRNYSAICLIPITGLLIYTFAPNRLVFLIILGAIIFSNLLFLLLFYKKHRNTLFENGFYFILYLCIFEIAPYFILYKMVEPRV